MGRYGVEEEFWVGEYHFEVNFSNDDAGGHGPRDIWVARRKVLEDLALTGFTGPQLLEAYDGPDQDVQKEAFAHRLEALRTSYFSARLYGSRSHKNKQVMQHLKEVADDIGRQDRA